jgi:HAMP domain-containing protein
MTNKNIDIETISQTHNRTIGGINSRRREIAYKMYLKNVSMKEIINQTKLDDECIRQTIERRQNNNSKKITEIKTPISIESEIAEMKNEIKDLKNTIKELVDMMKAVYEFEDV